MRVYKKNAKGKSIAELASMRRNVSERVALLIDLILNSNSPNQRNLHRQLDEAMNDCPCDEELIEIPEEEGDCKSFKCPTCGCRHYFSKDLENGY